MPMKIYDISQSIPECEVYPGDPSPKIDVLASIAGGDLYNLTEFSMCTHSGTHIDAPRHFLNDGDGVDRIPLEKTVGMAYVVSKSGLLTARDAEEMLSTAHKASPDAARRILIKGDAVVSAEAAAVFASRSIFLIGTESKSVGDESAPMEVHLTLLRAKTVLLEGIRLDAVSDGVYLLFAAPLSIKDADGSPCRALLCELS